MAAKRKESTPEIGKKHRDKIMSETVKLANRVGLTPRRTLLRIKQGLDATDQKVFYDSNRGKCVLGPPLVAYGARCDYAKLAVTVLDMKPSDKLDVNVNGNLPELLREARERAAKRGKD